mgnify:CR=1 FL=1
MTTVTSIIVGTQSATIVDIDMVVRDVVIGGKFAIYNCLGDAVWYKAIEFIGSTAIVKRICNR